MDKLTLPYCLREIANNIEREHRPYIRIGSVLLDYNGEEDFYEVHCKNGKTYTYSDLITVINMFIGEVAYM